jgi:hypothetical protein
MWQSFTASRTFEWTQASISVTGATVRNNVSGVRHGRIRHRYFTQFSTWPRSMLGVLKRCKTTDRMVLLRHYLEGEKIQEIAEIAGMV